MATQKDTGSERDGLPGSRSLLLTATLLPVLLGGAWLWSGAREGLWGVVLGWPPGALLLATGLSNLLWAGNSRILHFMALGALLGTLLAVPYFALIGPPAAALLLLSASGFIAAGYISLEREPVPPGVPAPEPNLKVSARAAEDEASMCYLVITTWPVILGKRARRVRDEMEEALELFEEKGWLDRPATYHRAPPPVTELRRRRRQRRGIEYEYLSFESGYEPWPEEPGRDRWLSYGRNRTAYAWALRHPGECRPWLVCVPGIRMGSPRLDFSLFQPEYLHRELGLNLLVPVLPIHGPRRVGIVSGDRILSGDLMDTLHAGAQAMWDIRRMVSRLRLEGAPAVGVLGHSLGGYAAALLCCLVRDLDCTIVGNPAVDYSSLFWRNALSAAALSLRSAGVEEDEVATLTRVISPLVLRPLVPKERLAIFGGAADRVVPPSEPESLWRHWGEPRIAWYQGGHQGFLHHPEARGILVETLAASGMLPQEDPEEDRLP